jgi:hypothetical protein
MVGILSEDTNRGSFVRDNLGGSVDELEGVEFMVIDTSNINFAHVHGYACVVAENATIGASIHEGTSLAEVFTHVVRMSVRSNDEVELLGVGTVATEGKTLVCSVPCRVVVGLFLR